ncbi:MAG: DMT family transporter [Patescibacteria group bacterium]
MFGVFLLLFGTLCEEVSLTIGKFAVRRRMEGVNTIGFVNSFQAIPFLLVPFFLYASERSLVVSHLGLVLFLTILNVAQSFLTVHALSRASRTTFGFVRTGTIPLVLLFDALLGYNVSFQRIAGILIITATMFLLYKNHGIERRGIWWAIFSAVNGAITTTIFKYLVSHGNGVAAVSLISYASMAFVMFLVATRAKERPFFHARKPLVLAQSAALGIASIVENYAFLFLQASVVMALKRSLSVVWSIVSGREYFHERHLWTKIAGCAGLLIGMALLAL